jgi:hypothetical protein
VPASAKLAPVTPTQTDAARRYRFDATSCNACHKDPHVSDASYRRSCDACHTIQSWNTLRPFNHAETKFPLQEAHQKPPCNACHKPNSLDASLAAKNVPSFAKLAGGCYSCHADPHAGQFRASAPEKDCSVCHTMRQWKIDTAIAASLTEEGFNHDRTRFPLDRSHRNVQCARCHPEQAGPDRKPLHRYRGTPIECTQCH